MKTLSILAAITGLALATSLPAQSPGGGGPKSPQSKAQGHDPARPVTTAGVSAKSIKAVSGGGQRRGPRTAKRTGDMTRGAATTNTRK